MGLSDGHRGLLAPSTLKECQRLQPKGGVKKDVGLKLFDFAKSSSGEGE